MDTHANDAYFNVYLPLLAEGIAPPLPVVGGSMSPYLVSGRDHVFLCPLRGERLRVGDICLYRRENGAYILHRIVGQKHGTFTFAGDAQTEREYGIRREQILARVTAVERGGKRQSGGFWHLFFRTVWILVLPLRHRITAIYGRMRGKSRGKDA